MNMIKKINYIFSKKQKVKLAELAIIIAIGALVELLGVSAILPFIDAMMNPSNIMNKAYLKFIYNTFQLQSANELLIVLALALIIIYILKNIYIGLMYDAQYRFSYNNLRRLANRILQSYMEQDYLFHVSHNSAELMRNVSTDSAQFFSAVLACLQLVTEVCVCIVLTVFLFIQDKTITTIVAMIIVLFAIVFMKLIQKRVKRLGEACRDNNSNISKWLLQSFGGIKETKIANSEDFFMKKYDKEFESYAANQRKYQLYCVLPRPIFETIFICSLLVVICFKLISGVQMEHFVSILSIFAVAAIRMLPSFNRITGYLSTIIFNRPSVDAVFDDLKNIEYIKKSNQNKICETTPITFEKTIQLDDLYFHYPDVDKNIIENVSIEINKNKSVAFVGASGAGKTTLADIILGILEPTSGKVLVDGNDIQYHMNSWHSLLGYIPQTIYLMDDTLRNNIAFGLFDEEIDENKVWRALEDAQLKDFVDELEQGLDTRVGERGVRLSGGQRQRIGIARALYNNPEILVLDEATSALDVDTETAVMDAINHLSGKKTLLIIAHRLSTIENCDVIYEVKDGKVIRK